MYDYHTHSNFSDDCLTPMYEMVDAAIKKGIKEIAVTDHFDPDYPDPDYPFLIDFKEYHNALRETADMYRNKIKVRKGIELGIQHGDVLSVCDDAVNAFPYDFVLGSFHSAHNQALYKQYFSNRDIEDGFRDFYMYMADCIDKYKNFDVLGHFNVIDRYSERLPDYAPYMEIIGNILKALIENGKGLELNTSSFRYGLGDRTTPSKEILKLYRQLGGEIITIGSDAHNTNDIGYYYHEATDILKSHGFKYLSLFGERKVSFVKI